eukprot:CAMPEP_0119376366 /NCGR_PEP_ID=MMETSP1334-20130426/40037_1 /TAXON_ID=127549 /ORGANISM="Calcidiscus leptoporus, Strain RCC1130" /LENGTH=30 /DNA_ID= /DNA_START= /DNA_END= /DNA_ORIENTATION=
METEELASATTRWQRHVFEPTQVIDQPLQL